MWGSAYPLGEGVSEGSTASPHGWCTPAMAGHCPPSNCPNGQSFRVSGPHGKISPRVTVPQVYCPTGSLSPREHLCAGFPVQVSLCRCQCTSVSVCRCPYACVCVQESMRRYLCADVHIQMSCVQVPCADVCVQVSVCRCQDHIAQVHLFGCMLAIIDPLTLHEISVSQLL